MKLILSNFKDFIRKLPLIFVVKAWNPFPPPQTHRFLFFFPWHFHQCPWHLFKIVAKSGKLPLTILSAKTARINFSNARDKNSKILPERKKCPWQFREKKKFPLTFLKSTSDNFLKFERENYARYYHFLFKRLCHSSSTVTSYKKTPILTTPDHPSCCPKLTMLGLKKEDIVF